MKPLIDGWATKRPPITQSSDRGQILRPTGWDAIAHLGKPLLIYFGGLLLILGAGEGWVELQSSLNQPPRRFVARYPTPYVEFYAEPNYNENGISINEVGFRYGPLPTQKPPGETRIFFLSASPGFRGTTNDTTIAGFMESMIAERATGDGKRVRVVNASGTSFVTRQSLVLLVTKVLEYDPDIIVIFHGPETLYYPVVCEERLGYPFKFRTREAGHEKLVRYLKRPHAFVAAIASTHTMQYFHPDLVRKLMQTEFSKLAPHIPLTSVSELDPHIEGVASDVRKMISIATAFSCRTVVAMPPWLASGIAKDALPKLSKRLEEECRRAGDGEAIFLDTSSVGAEITRRGLWHSDEIHWSDEGNRIMASELVRVLVENKMVD